MRHLQKLETATVFVMVALFFISCGDNGTKPPPNVYDISGYVMRPDGITPVPGVTMTLTGYENRIDTTDVDGYYSLTDLEGEQDYTVTPIKTGWIFDPDHRDYLSLNTDRENENYTGEGCLDEELQIAFDPDPVYVSAGNSVNVEVKILNAQNLVSARVTITYDADKVEVTGLDITGLASNLFTSTGASIVISEMDYDTPGTVTFGLLGRKDGFQGVSGDGPIAEITFLAKVTDPTTDLTFATVELYDYPVANPPVPIADVCLNHGTILPPQ
jgi:hypothetical protein